MSSSKRFYITLNSEKEKDRIILDFLGSTYSETETIKSILYQVATNGSNSMQLGKDDCVNDMNQFLKNDDLGSKEV